MKNEKEKFVIVYLLHIKLVKRTTTDFGCGPFWHDRFLQVYKELNELKLRRESYRHLVPKIILQECT